MILQAQNKTSDAVERYRKALQLDGSAAVAANNLAWLYAEEGERLDEALQLAQSAKSRLPESAEVNDTLGWVYVKKGLPTLAVASLKQSVAANPSNPDFHFHLGVALAGAGDAANAKRSFEHALTLGPSTGTAAEIRERLSQLSR